MVVGCETSRHSHFLDNRLTYGGEVVIFTRRPPFTPRKIPGNHFCLRLRLSQLQGHNAAKRTRILKRNPMTSSGIEPETFRLVELSQSSTLPCAPK
jgi:hypothetical protein